MIVRIFGFLLLCIILLLAILVYIGFKYHFEGTEFVIVFLVLSIILFLIYYLTINIINSYKKNI